MRSPYDNTFVLYRDERENEEIVTSSFLTALEKAPDVYKREVAELLSPVSVESPEFRLEVRASRIKEKEAYLVGLSNSDPVDVPFADDSSGKITSDTNERFDIVIDINDNQVVVVEVKTNSSGFKKLDKYAELLGIDAEQKLNFVQWQDVDDLLADIDVGSQVADIFIGDFRELLRFNSPGREVIQQAYKGGDQNVFRIEQGANLKVQTPHAPDARAPVALEIDITEDGSHNVYFTPEEWGALVADMDTDVFDAFLSANFQYFADLYDTNGRTIVAQTGEYPKPRKIIQVSKSRGSIVVGFRRGGKDKRITQGKYPMMAEWEFEQFFGEELSENEVEQLFIERDITVFL